MVGEFTVVNGLCSVRIDFEPVMIVEVRYSWKTRSSLPGHNLVHVLGYWPFRTGTYDQPEARAFEIDLLTGVCAEREVTELFPDAGKIAKLREKT